MKDKLTKRSPAMLTENLYYNIIHKNLSPQISNVSEPDSVSSHVFSVDFNVFNKLQVAYLIFNIVLDWCSVVFSSVFTAKT